MPRTAGPEEPFRSLAPDPLERVSLEALARRRRRGLAPKVEPEVATPTTSRPIRASVRDAVEARAAPRCPTTGPMSFRDLVAGIDDKLEIIVRFLACLELFKQGVVDLAQTETFGELIVRRLAAASALDLEPRRLDDDAESTASRADRRDPASTTWSRRTSARPA